MFPSSTVLLVFFSLLPYLVTTIDVPTEEPLPEELLEFQANEERTYHCPSDNDAVRSCKPWTNGTVIDTFFTYTTCCPNNETHCCTHIKEWVWIAGGVSVAVVGAITLTCLARCVFRFKNKSHQSYDFA